MTERFWVLKSEPDCYSIDDLQRDGKTHWDGIRNYQARNFLRDAMQAGDLCLFHHSSTEPPAVAGICKVVKKSYPDFTQFDPKSDHPDASSDPENPRWFMVDVAFEEKLKHPVSLAAMKANPRLTKMRLLERGNRLSVFPITKEEFYEVVKMGGEKES